jgi:hypothetical protein
MARRNARCLRLPPLARQRRTPRPSGGAVQRRYSPLNALVESGFSGRYGVWCGRPTFTAGTYLGQALLRTIAARAADRGGTMLKGLENPQVREEMYDLFLRMLETRAEAEGLWEEVDRLFKKLAEEHEMWMEGRC